MKQLTYILALLLGSLGVMAQTNQPLPAGSKPLSNILYLAPDSTVWTGDEFNGGLFVKVAKWNSVDSLFKLGYTKAQVDSAITANLSDYIPLSQKGSPNGVATIDGGGKVPLTQIPEALLGAVNYQGSYNAATNTPALPSSPGSGTKGHYYVVSTAGTQFGNSYSEGDWIISNGVEWQKVDNNNAVTSVNGQVGSVVIDVPVTSVNGETGAVMLDAADIGLGNVDNTSDLNKPVSTATQTALNGKENAFSKGNIVAGAGVSLTGTLTGRLVGSGDVAISATNSLTASNGIQINSGNITPVYGTAANTIAQGNDSRINNGQTAFGWGNHKPLGLGSLHYLDGWGYSSLTDLGGANNRPTSFIGTNIQSPDGTISGFQYPFGIHMNVSDVIRGDIIISQSSNRLAFRSQGRPFTEVWTSNNFTPPVAFTRSENGLVPAPGGSTTDRFLSEDGTWKVPTGGGGGGTATNLSIQNRTSTTLDIGSSTGAAATIPVATTSLGGLMSATDKQALNSAITFEEDPQVPSYVKSITSSNIANWNTAYNRGNFRAFGLGDALSTPPGNLDTLFYSGFYYTSNVTLNRPYDYANVISISGGVTSGTQLFIPITSGNSIVYRRKTTAGTWSSFINVWDSSNFTPSNYLPTANFTWTNLSGKPSTFAPSPHSHNASDINAGTLAIARIPTGTTGSTVALGNHTHAFSAITSKPTNLSGYGITDAVPSSLTINGKSLTTNVTLTASDVSAVPLSGNATVSGTKTFSSPVIVPNGTASNHAVNLSQITGSGSLILGTEPNKVKTNYQNDTTYVRKSDIIPLTASMSVPGNTIAAESSISQTFGVPGVTASDVVVVNIDGPSMLLGKASAINGGVNVWLVNPTSSPMSGYSTINLRIVVIKYQ